MPKGVYPRKGIEDRFWGKVEKTATCWLWQGHLSRGGYGHFAVGSRPIKAHRFAYSLINGEIPDGLVVLHSCDTPACVNPDHLSVGTDSDNQRDSVQKKRHRESRKSICPHGHPYSEDNTYVDPRGRRQCRVCRATANRRWKESK